MTAASEVVLSVTGLTKSFAALKVSDDISLDVRKGEIHAIIGPNGAGKTTLIQQLAGGIRPDFGRITMQGRDVTRLSVPKRARLGLARSFQITELLSASSVLENTALAVQARQGSSFRFLRPVAQEDGLNAQAMQALQQAGIADRAQRLAGTLSHGEKRQLEIAIALAMRPKLLLLDEPLAGTGPHEAAGINALIASLKGSMGIVLVEHDMAAVFALADRISVLAGGRLIATGTADEIRSNADVRAAYLGEDA